jgi:hypothetical protein
MLLQFWSANFGEDAGLAGYERCHDELFGGLTGGAFLGRG